MTPQIIAQLAMVFVVSAMAVLLFSIWRSSHGTPSPGLSVLGTLLLVLGIGLRMRARRGGQG
jgi:hypothetical protein